MAGRGHLPRRHERRARECAAGVARGARRVRGEAGRDLVRGGAADARRRAVGFWSLLTTAGTVVLWSVTASIPTPSSASRAPSGSISSRSSATRWPARWSRRTRPHPDRYDVSGIHVYQQRRGHALPGRAPADRGAPPARPHRRQLRRVGDRLQRHRRRRCAEVRGRTRARPCSTTTSVRSNPGRASSAASLAPATSRSATTRTTVKTAATFLVDAEGRRWVLPGDLATIEADGDITIFGRGSQVVNTGGEKVFPEEVEAVLKAHPGVFDAVVVGVPDERFGEHVAALVVWRDDDDPDTHRPAPRTPARCRRIQGPEGDPRARRRATHTRRQTRLPVGQRRAPSSSRRRRREHARVPPLPTADASGHGRHGREGPRRRSGGLHRHGRDGPPRAADGRAARHVRGAHDQRVAAGAHRTARAGSARAVRRVPPPREPRTGGGHARPRVGRVGSSSASGGDRWWRSSPPTAFARLRRASASRA